MEDLLVVPVLTSCTGSQLHTFPRFWDNTKKTGVYIVLVTVTFYVHDQEAISIQQK